MKIASLLLCIPLALAACGNDDGMSDAGGGGTDGGTCTTMGTFADLHAKILNTTSCNAAAACHGAPGQGGLLITGDVAASYMSTTGATAQTESRGAFPQRVVANNPAQSFLVEKMVNENVPRGRMPLAGSKLSDCDLAAFNTWINNGALND